MDSVITQDPSGSPYINDIECQPPSPESNLSHLDSTLTFNPLASPPYNGSYNGSPYSGHSELSYIEDFPNLFDDGIGFRDYDPAEYDPPDTSSLLMFSDTDFVQPPYDATLSVGSSDLHSTQPYDYSSPSSNASATDDRIRSRASSVSSNPHSHQHTPLIYTSTLDVALENMKFSHSPNWGTDPLPHNEPMQKHPSPPRLLMPEAPPTINVPDGDGLGDGSGPSLNIVPATPISGGGLTSDNTVPFQTRLENLTGHAQPPAWADPSGGAGAGSTSSSDQQGTPLQRQQHQFDFLQQPHNYIAHPRSLPGTPATRPVILEDVTSNNASGVGPPGGGGLGANTNFLFPQPIPKSRSKSDTALEPPNWDTSATATFVNQSQNNSAVDDGPSPGSGTVNMQEVQGQGVSYTSPPSTGHSLQSFNFPANNSSNNGYLTAAAPGPMRRAKSDSIGRHRQSHSDDIRSLAILSQPGNIDTSLYYNRQGNIPPNSAPPPTSTTPGFLSPPQTHVSRFLSPLSGDSSIPIRSHHRYSRSLSSASHLTPDYSHGPGPGPIRRSPSSTRSERGSVWSDASSAGAAPGSNRVSPYPSPKASPRPNLGDLPGPGAYDDMIGMGRVNSWMGAGNQHLSIQQQQQQQHGNGNLFGGLDPSPHIMPRMTSGMGGGHGQTVGFHGAVGFSGLEGGPVSQGRAARNVRKNNVTTERTRKASVNRRKADAPFVCTVPGCGSTFTRSFNLKGHMRSHNEEKPFVCHWPGCTKAFARQHDCKRHEALHSNYRPFTCEGCSKQFARMDALNRHLRSEGGAECAKVQKPASMNGSPVGGQAMLNGLISQVDEMEVDFGDLLSEGALGDAEESLEDSSGAEDTKPIMLRTKIEDDWPGGIAV